MNGPDFVWSYPPGMTEGPFDNRAEEENEGKESEPLFTDKFDNEHGYTISKFWDTKEPELVGKDEVSMVYCIKICTTDDECNGIEIDLAFEEEHLRNEVYELLKHLYDVEQVS